MVEAQDIQLKGWSELLCDSRVLNKGPEEWMNRTQI